MNEYKTKVSVVVPVYNVEPYIRQCLDSLVNQSLKDIEIIVVDDGSPDNCPQIIDEYAAKDKRIKPIHKKNGGVSAARNDGLAVANGEYLYFVDSDDWLEVDALNLMYDAAVRAQADVVIGDYNNSYSTGKNIRKMSFSNEFTTNDKETISVIQAAVCCNGYSKFKAAEFSFSHGLAAPWHQMVKKDLVKAHNIQFNVNVKGMFDDGLFTLEIYEYAKTVSYIKKVCYNYRIVEGSLTNGYSLTVIDKYLLAIQEIDEFIDRFKKDSYFRKASMIRRFVYLNLAVENCFLHPLNPKKENERYKDFLTYAKNEEFSCMYKELNPSMVGLKRSALLARLVKMRFFRLYWCIKKLSR